MIDDIELAAVIAAYMHAGGRVPSSVTIEVSDGVVTLGGTCETEEERQAAESLVLRFHRRVTGVVNTIALAAHGPDAA